MAREPGYCKHKPTGQAYVNLGGKVIYLGTYGTEESKLRYNRVKAEWLVNRHAAKFQPKAASGPTVSDICNAFLDHAESYYSASNEFDNFKRACRPLSELFATMYASEFGVVQFRACREWWLNGTRSRQYINKQMQRLLKIMKWSVGQGLIPPSVHQSLLCVDSLKKGRTSAKESNRVTCVEQSLVDKTLPLLTKVVADMVRFQQLVGCRPGEVCSITPSMVDRSGEVWMINLAKHKTEWRGNLRTLYVGPQAQAILMKYLVASNDSPCFSPIESEKQRFQKRHEERVTPPNQGNRPKARGPRKSPGAPGESFTSGTYARSVRNACKRGKLKPWSPNQLRHNAATSIRKEFGLEAAQLILGHSEMGVTQIYAEQDRSKAIAVAKAIG